MNGPTPRANLMLFRSKGTLFEFERSSLRGFNVSISVNCRKKIISRDSISHPVGLTGWWQRGQVVEEIVGKPLSHRTMCLTFLCN